MWNTCEQLQAVKQWKYEEDLFFCLLKKFTVPVLFISSLRMQNNCRLFTLVGSDDEIKAGKVIAYTWIGLYHLLSIMLLHIYKKKVEGRDLVFCTVASLSKVLNQPEGRCLSLIPFYISWDLVEVWQVAPLSTERGQECSCTRYTLHPSQLSKWLSGMSWTLLKHFHPLGKGWINLVTKENWGRPCLGMCWFRTMVSFHHILIAAHLPTHSFNHSAAHSPWTSCPLFLSLVLASCSHLHRQGWLCCLLGF